MVKNPDRVLHKSLIYAKNVYKGLIQERSRKFIAEFREIEDIVNWGRNFKELLRNKLRLT